MSTKVNKENAYLGYGRDFGHFTLKLFFLDESLKNAKTV